MGWLRVDGVLLFQTVSYFVLLACGLATSISSGIVRRNLGSTCILYGTVNCTAINNTATFFVFGGNMSVCAFITVVSIFVSVFFVMILNGYHLHFVIKSRTVSHVIYQMRLKALFVSSIIATFLTLLSACMLTVGITMWCNEVVSAAILQSVSVSSCSETQWRPWQWYTSNGETSISLGSYYDLYAVAETSCWVSVCIWLLESSLYLRFLFKTRQQQTISYQDPFTIDDQDDFS